MFKLLSSNWNTLKSGYYYNDLVWCWHCCGLQNSQALLDSDTERAMESVGIEGVSVLSELNLEKL